MGISHSEAYAAAGVDIEAGYQGVKMMNRYVQRTLTADVISDLGGFSGLFSLDLHGLEKPVLVSGTDGVGTKQRIAQLMDRHNTVGIDCVAMCVNDIICCGAKPLFFLDYIAIGARQLKDCTGQRLLGFGVNLGDRQSRLLGVLNRNRSILIGRVFDLQRFVVEDIFFQRCSFLHLVSACRSLFDGDFTVFIGGIVTE